MRLIGKLNTRELANQFCTFLNQEGIESEYEMKMIKDWGNNAYGEPHFSVWIIDEDQIEKATKEFELFLQNPDDGRFRIEKTETIRSFSTDVISPKVKTESFNQPTWAPSQQGMTKKMGVVTLYVLMSCIWIFAWTWLSSPDIPSEVAQQIPKNLPFLAIYASPIYKVLIYDYPKNDELIDEIIEKYGLETLAKPNEMPAAAAPLIQEYNQTRIWNGLYPYFISMIKKESTTSPANNRAPLFEKIGHHEWWRLITPIFLHGNLIHLMFNGLWVLVLGAQIEERIKRFRYILLILISAALSNTAQYLISGPNFIGISGVVCAMLSFVWVRERQSPWEGYRVPESTFKMVLVFILGMVVLQMIASISDVYFNSAFNPGIANTAHLVGGITGYLMAKIPLFKARKHAN